MKAIKNDRDPSPHIALRSFESCGCTAWICVLGYGHDADAYKEAAREAKAGRSVEQVEVEAWKATGSWHCVDHPNGPPWWESRGGNGKRPAAETVGMGL